MRQPPPPSALFPYTTLFRSDFRRLLGLDEFIRTPVRQLSLGQRMRGDLVAAMLHDPKILYRSEEHTSELQSHHDLVCRLLLEKKNETLPNHQMRAHHCVLDG